MIVAIIDIAVGVTVGRICIIAGIIFKIVIRPKYNTYDSRYNSGIRGAIVAIIVLIICIRLGIIVIVSIKYA